MTTRQDEVWMRRALDLARKGRTSPNPKVGCVIVSASGTFLGEGFHKAAGMPHAEIEALASVPAERRTELPGATYFVTLEPCSHFGRTPPCADRLVAEKAGRVVVAAEDPNPLVAGQGLQRLRAAGIETESGLCAEEAAALNAPFFVNMREQRPYVILKWAQSADGFIDSRVQAAPGAGGIALTGKLAGVINHAWRAEVDGILVGRRTVEIDLPRLTNRRAPGPSPQAFVLDPSGKLPEGHPFFTQGGKRWTGSLEASGLHSLIVEGGRVTLERWMAEQPFDEIRRFTALDCQLQKGLEAPHIPGGFQAIHSAMLGRDLLEVFRPC